MGSTFGCTPGSPGASSTNNSADNCTVCKYTLAADGDVFALTVYGTKSSGGTMHLKGVIYADNGGQPGTLVAVTDEAAITNSTGWWTLRFAAPVALTAGDYWIGWLGDDTFTYNYDAGAADQRWYGDDTYADGPEDPFSTTNPGSHPRAKSIFASYAARSFLSGFNRRQALVIDAVPHIAGDVTVPVAIHVPSGNTDFWSNEDGQGGYVRFTADDGTTLLDFEVESYDGAGDDAWFHVEVTLDADVPTVVHLNYGADTPSDGSSATDTWDADFVQVYHLNEDLPGGDETTDSKGSSDLTASGSPVTNAAVALDKGVDLEADNDEHYTLAGNAPDYSEITVEAWVQFESLSGTQGIVASYDGGGDRNYLLYKQTGGDIVFRMYDGGDGAEDSGAFTPSAGVLYHLVGVLEADGPELYVNGSKVGSGSVETGGLRGDTCTMRVGAFNATNTLDGLLDEVTISDVDRGADWVGARYRSGLGAWLSFGSEETSGGGTGTEDIQLPAGYRVRTTQNVSLPAGYGVTGQANEINLPAGYRVGQVPDLQLPAGYRVRAAKEVQLPAGYGVTGGSGTISLTEPTERSVVQRSGGLGSLALSGTYTGSPTAIEARMVLHGTSTEVLAWTTVDASPSGGSWSGTLAGIPQGGWYNVQVRFSNEVGTTDDGTNRVGVGVLIGCIGQSNISHWFETGYGSDTAGDPISYYNDTGWAQVPDTWGPACVFGNGIADVLGIPVGLIDYGVGGSALDITAGGPGGGQWMDTGAGTNYQAFLDGVAAVGGDLEMVVWDQGERDAGDSISYATYLADLDTFFARIRTDIRADLPIILSPLRRVTDSGHTESDAVWQGIMDAQIEKVRTDPLTFLGATEKDLELRGDGLHLSDAGYVTQTERLARACLAVTGEAGFYRGPQPVSYTIAGSTVDVRLRHRGTADIVPDPGTDYTGWEVLDDGSPVTISSATRLDRRTIRLTLAFSPTGLVTVRHLYGKAPDVSNVARSAGTVALPVEVAGDIPAARTLSLTLVDRDGTPRTSLTGLRWALFDLSLPEAFEAPVHRGSGETTDGSGVFRVDIPETDVPAGGDAWLVISDSDGTASQNPTSVAFSAPVAV